MQISLSVFLFLSNTSQGQVSNPDTSSAQGSKCVYISQAKDPVF